MADKTEADIDVLGSPKAIMDAIADVASNEGVTSVDYLDYYPDGRPKTLKMVFSAGPIAGDMVLEYAWDEPNSMSWKLIEGKTITQWDGCYTITPNADGTNNVKYQLQADVSMPMIGMIRHKAEKQVIKFALKALKTRVES